MNFIKLFTDPSSRNEINGSFVFKIFSLIGLKTKNINRDLDLKNL
jgi:hypothetical protein